MREMKTKPVRIPIERYEHIRKYYLGQNGAFTFAEAFEQYIENIERRIEEAEAKARSWKDAYEHLYAAVAPSGGGTEEDLETLSKLFEDKEHEEKARLNRLWKGLKSIFG